MKSHIITLFPEVFAPLQHSICGRAIEQNQFDLDLIQLRDFAINKYGQVDDAPFGGEAGMVIRPEPLSDAIDHATSSNQDQPVIYLSADGEPLTQEISKELATLEEFTLVCGHYKGIDQRIRDTRVTREISIGDYVLTGGELPAMVLLDSIIRLLPGVMGDIKSAETDSFWNNRLGWPVYTRPAEWNGLKVPQILTSGHHKKIQEWQIDQSLKLTELRRPDLFDLDKKIQPNR
jgi:tRNA (guanine37-N1)-methyltransferase